MSFIQVKTRYGLNTEPRLSANQLAEYLGASPTRRKSITRDAKYPKVAIVTQLKEARSTISKCLSQPGSSGDIISEAANKISLREAKLTSTDWTKQDCANSMDAIGAFQRSWNGLALARFTFTPATGGAPPLSLGGVSVSVALDARVHRRDRQGTLKVGGLILSLGRSETNIKLRADRGVHTATLCFLFCEQHLSALGKPDPALCFCLDVFGGLLHPAPTQRKQRVSNMELACEEVALRWPTIEPPADYDGPTC